MNIQNSKEKAKPYQVRQVLAAIERLEEIQEQALSGIHKLVRGCTEDLKACGEQVPEPIATKNYSGKFMVRVPPETHRHLAMQAAEAGVSLNRLIASRLH